MSYVDAYYDKDHDRVNVVERVDGKRVFRNYPAVQVFYFPDPGGKYMSIFGTPVSRVACATNKEFFKEKQIHAGKQLFESDLNPVFRCLEDNYLEAVPPTLNMAYFDIETGFDSSLGFAPPDDPFNPVTAITVYLAWLDKLVTFALPPSHLSMETANTEIKDFSDTFLFTSEAELLVAFLDLIEDADVISGWNSGGFDIPYLVNRVTKVVGKEANRKWCLWDRFPKKRTYEAYGKEATTYDLHGRVHMDYLDLYRKFTYEERHSYSLDAIGEYELGDRKIPYEGTLDELYRMDFKKFIEYNRQDVMLVARIDEKLKFMALANALAHKNTVLLMTAMGSVAMIEQAVVNEAHRRGVVVPDKVREQNDESQAAGAYVANPVRGMHEYVGSIDINSLYPSTIRALNMGQETIVGQLRPTLTGAYMKEKELEGVVGAALWEGLFATLEYTAVMSKTKDTLILDWADGGSENLKAEDVWHLVFDSNLPWGISANGTIFTFEKKAIVPGLLERWYAERKQYQAKLKELIESGAPKLEIEYWDRLQLVTKIQLNSAYGSLLNIHCRFYDKRIGQSTTLTGRSICKHMASYVNETLAGEYDHVGHSVIAGDTDSCYFSAWPIIQPQVESGELAWDKDSAISLYDAIADGVNESFPAFMEKAFHCPPSYGSLIKGGREIVARRGIFHVKKRYALMYYDKDGHRYDTDGKPGKLKAMGLDLKRADTPKFVQEFLIEILEDALNGATKDIIIEKVIEFKHKFKNMNSWEKGTPKRVNNLTKFTVMHNKNPQLAMPGHARAAINWNNLRSMHADKNVMKIVDGQKTIVCKLRDNPLRMTSVAYPIDEPHLPEWFKRLPFDDEGMLKSVVDQKVENVLGVLDWEISSSTDIGSNFGNLFDF